MGIFFAKCDIFYLAERVLLCIFESVKPNKAIVAAVMLLFAVSCGLLHHTRLERVIREQLRTIQPLLLKSEKVDSCLAILQAMDTVALKRPADKARWSLLYTMALDKNYIDTTDLSVLAPAIECYTPWHHLSRKDKFYTWYYKARTEENARCYDASLDSYLHAERYMGATDDVYRTRLYFGFERVYMKTMAFNNAAESARQALKYAERSKSLFNIATALIDCSILASCRGRRSKAEEYLDKYDQLIGTKCPPKEGDYYRAKMIFFHSLDSHESDSSLYYLYKYIKSKAIFYPIPCAITCIKKGLYDEADRFLNMYDSTRMDAYDFQYSYYYCRSRVCESKGDYSGALSYLRQQEKFIDKGYMFSMDEGISYASEKYHNKLARMRVTIVAINVLLVMAIIFITMAFMLKERKNELNAIRQCYLVISEEYKAIINKKRDFHTGGRKDNTALLYKRLITLGNSISGRNDMNLLDASECLLKRSEPKEFEGAVAVLGSIHCRRYVTALSKSGLGTFEIAYCILGLSLSTKELAYLFKRKNLYNVNASIKECLGVSDKVRLKQKLNELYLLCNQS